MKIKFTADAVAILEKGPEKLFEQGDIQDIPTASADRWIRRGIAVAFDGEEKPAAKKVSKKAASKKE